MPHAMSDLFGEPLVTRRVRARPPDVVYIKNVIEASEGVACLFAEKGGDLVLAATPTLESLLDELIDDLRRELPLEIVSPAIDSALRPPE